MNDADHHALKDLARKWVDLMWKEQKDPLLNSYETLQLCIQDLDKICEYLYEPSASRCCCGEVILDTIYIAHHGFHSCRFQYEPDK